MEAPSINEDMRECIGICLDCSDVCNQTLMHCLTEGGQHAEAEHLRTLIDCMDICRTTASVMGRGSSLHVEMCRICSDICRACAESCRGVGGAVMESCATVCERCATSCDEMSAGAQGLGAKRQHIRPA